MIRVKTLGEKLTELCRIRQLATHCHRSRPRRCTTNWLKGKQGSLLRHFSPHCKALIDTLADRPADVEIETMDERVSQRYAQVLLKKLAYELRKVDVEGVNATVVEMNPQPLMD